MANVKNAIDFVLRQEDATLSGIITAIPGDDGGITRLGLTKRYYPQLEKQGFYDGNPIPQRPDYLSPTTVPTDRAIAMAEAAYTNAYAAALYLDQIEDQAICTALLSFAVVEGSAKAVELLQASLETCGHPDVVEDGVMGSKTVMAINATNPSELLDIWIVCEMAWFNSIAAKNPSQAKFVSGWNNRAAKLRTLLA